MKRITARPQNPAPAPAPGELVQLAVTLYGAPRLCDVTTRDQTLVDALAVWLAAFQLIERGGTELDLARRAMEVELSTASRAETGEPEKHYSIDEAYHALGYKDTRGERSFLELVQALDAHAPEEYSGLRTKDGPGLFHWIRETGYVTEVQLASLKKFRADRVKLARSAGGAARAVKRQGRNSQKNFG